MAPSLLDIPELTELDSGGALIRVPNQQNVPFTRRVRALVDTPEFQRLGEISQLGLVSRVYPGARHTRLEHALGVYHNALRYLRQLSRDPRFVEIVDRPTAELLIVSALLHDLGHWPFCHPIEDLDLPNLPPHEAHAARFLDPGTPLGKVLRDVWGIDSNDVLDVLVPRTQSQRLQLLRSIISGPIDVDKMDYLERDSLHCGVPYGQNFDKQRLIQSLVVNESGDGLAMTSKGKTAAELMVFARYVMFSEVYWHHAVRSATTMFGRAFYTIHERLDLSTLFAAGDALMIAEMRREARGTLAERLMEGVFGSSRGLYKRAAEFSEMQSPDVYRLVAQRPYEFLVECGDRLAARVQRQLGREVATSEVLIDAPPPHREIEFNVSMSFPKEGCYRQLRDVSPVVDALARTQFDDYTKRVRIFIAPELRSSLPDPDFWRAGIEEVALEIAAAAE